MAESVGYLQVWDRFLLVTRPNPNDTSQTETWAILGTDLGFDMSEEAGTMYLERASEGYIIYYDAYQHKRRITLRDTGIVIDPSRQPPGSVNIDPAGWLWYPWAGTKRDIVHEDAGHGDIYPHGDAAAKDIRDHSNSPHSDHSDNPNSHQDWSDHSNVSHTDTSPHSNASARPHENWSDSGGSTPHSNWSDHSDRRYSDAGGPHQNWSDTYTDTHSNYTDYDDDYWDYSAHTNNPHSDYDDYHDTIHVNFTP